MIILTEKTESIVKRESDIYNLPERMPLLLRLACCMARDIFRNKERVYPGLFSKIADKVGVIDVPLSNDEDRDTAELMMKAIARSGVEEMAFVAESWMARCAAADLNKAPRSSENPNRQEAVVIAYQSKDGKQIIASAFIDRPAGCKPRLLDWSVMDEYDGNTNSKVIGRFVGAYQE